jgi:hypothetical protein
MVVVLFGRGVAVVLWGYGVGRGVAVHVSHCECECVYIAGMGCSEERYAWEMYL